MMLHYNHLYQKTLTFDLYVLSIYDATMNITTHQNGTDVTLMGMCLNLFFPSPVPNSLTI